MSLLVNDASAWELLRRDAVAVTRRCALRSAEIRRRPRQLVVIIDAGTRIRTGVREKIARRRAIPRRKRKDFLRKRRTGKGARLWRTKKDQRRKRARRSKDARFAHW